MSIFSLKTDKEKTEKMLLLIQKVLKASLSYAFEIVFMYLK